MQFVSNLPRDRRSILVRSGTGLKKDVTTRRSLGERSHLNMKSEKVCCVHQADGKSCDSLCLSPPPSPPHSLSPPQTLMWCLWPSQPYDFNTSLGSWNCEVQVRMPLPPYHLCKAGPGASWLPCACWGFQTKPIPLVSSGILWYVVSW